MKTKESLPSYRITDMDESERPRERLAQVGVDSLKTAELLAILLRVGVTGENAVQVGERLLQDCHGLAGLHRISYVELCAQRGVGPAKAAQIKAAIELGNRLAKMTPEDRPCVHSPKDAADLVKYEMSALEQEELWVLLLDTRNNVLETEKAYRGSLNASIVRVGELFKGAIRRNAASILVIHNHPSGDPTPSPEDIALTRAIVQAGKLLDVEVLDHLVIGGNRYVSLKERGLGFSAG
ncbi:MAG TPA: DNA repair protein RadC [Anaerolineaceae bacterium]|nr:DNA repair protein RadC [Anaerolineaceae bacterium]